MKNLFLVPTDKPSRLWSINLSDTDELLLSIEEVETSNNQHIYITNSEEIKEGDWCLCSEELVHKVVEIKSNIGIIRFQDGVTEVLNACKKIILTTDPDLIADGVQAIDNGFLEWFVKNPTVKYVKIERLEDGKYVDYLVDGSAVEGVYENYKIIIPEEEPKCTCEEHDPYCCEVHGICPTCVKKEEPKQETLEEAANRLFYTVGNEGISSIDSFMKSANYQSERMYSEEDMREAFKANYTPFSATNIGDVEQDFQKWFEQFKKK